MVRARLDGFVNGFSVNVDDLRAQFSRRAGQIVYVLLGRVRDLDTRQGQDVPTIRGGFAVLDEGLEGKLQVAVTNMVGDGHNAVSRYVGATNELDRREYAVAEEGMRMKIKHA